MTLPDDQAARFRCYRNALRNWNYEGYIQARERVGEWLSDELPDYGWREICRTLQEYVEGGGEIDEQPESRQEYTYCRFHYDLRVRIGGRHLYFETVLIVEDADDPDDPVIIVVNVHDV